MARGEVRRFGDDLADLGLRWFLASLAILFAAALVGYGVVRAGAETWPPPGTPEPPAILFWSTLLIVASTAIVEGAVRASRRGRAPLAAALLLATFASGVAFLAMQSIAWIRLVEARVTSQAPLYGFTFWVLTVLHAAHVVGGLIPLAVTTVRAYRRRYHWASHAGIRRVAAYWHFLTVVWTVLYLALIVWD